MLYIIGLGLADEKDVSVKGLEVIRKAERVYLEAYTAVLLVDQKQLVSSVRAASMPDLMLNRCNAVGKLLWPLCYPRRSRNGRVPIR